ncbi:MAG: hypothetical protein JSR44_11100 [Spirochaetes bacterium]|nr:hypothetical protein [Spirochaetota bacterium]
MLRIIALTSLLGLCMCAHTGDGTSTTITNTVSTAQTCKVYATNLTDTTNSITYSCTFNGSTTLSCTNGGAETITITYPDLKSFVNEAATPVSVFNKNAASSMVSQSATPSLAYNITYTYNAAGQWSGTTNINNGVTTSITYTAWDANNRPTAGTASFTAGAVCTGRALTTNYVDGSTRTRTTVASGGVGTNCGLLNIPINQVDVVGNPVQILGRNITTNATATACY